MLDNSDYESAQNSFLKETHRNEAIPQAVREQIEARFSSSTSANYSFPRVSSNISPLIPFSRSLQALRVRTVIDGPIAFAELKMSFENPRKRELEGRFEASSPVDVEAGRFLAEAYRRRGPEHQAQAERVLERVVDSDPGDVEKECMLPNGLFTPRFLYCSYLQHH